MITSRDNSQLKQIHKLQRKKERDATGLFVAEGEDLVEAAEAAGWTPEILLRSGEDVEPELLDRVSALGSGARVIGVYRQRLGEPRGDLCVYLHGVADPGNVGTIVRAAHALADGPVVLGPGCADPFGPKAVRASMGSVFARPPARAELADLDGHKLALDSGASASLSSVAADLQPPLVLCVGGERDGLPPEIVDSVEAIARIPQRLDGPDSLNVAMATTIGLYELGNRMAGHA
ncbi:MAG TPA: RNA methyltransferase [Thermoleophilaceae bacterium]|nr:RNA methyltransferase [Thermoleophilaceae bacterium]